MKRCKPEILSVAATAQSKLFRIEAVHLLPNSCYDWGA